MFHGEHWAEVFVDVLGGDAGQGLGWLRTMVPPIQAIPGELFGRSAAIRLEKLLREAAASSGAKDAAVEYAIRFVSLLVEKNCFRHIDSLLLRIEKKLDNKNGILDVLAESAGPLDSSLVEELRRQIMEKTGAAGIKMETRVRPELLGGYRLRIGDFHIDASLKNQLEQLTEELTATAIKTTPLCGR